MGTSDFSMLLCFCQFKLIAYVPSEYIRIFLSKLIKPTSAFTSMIYLWSICIKFSQKSSYTFVEFNKDFNEWKSLGFTDRKKFKKCHNEGEKLTGGTEGFPFSFLKNISSALTKLF